MQINKQNYYGITFKGNGRLVKNAVSENVGKSLNSYWNGYIVCLTDKNRPVSAHVETASHKDTAEIAKWFENYEDPWRDWWLDFAKNNNPEIEVRKMQNGTDNKILGLVALSNKKLDLQDGRFSTWVRGVRVAPEYSDAAKCKEIKGIGSSLLVHSLIESCKVGADGIAINSTVGKEGFYEKVGLESMISFISGKTNFFLKDDLKIIEFLTEKIISYEKLLRI